MEMIRRISCLIALTFTFSNISVSQTFTNTPNDTFQLTGMLEDLQTLTISQVNTSNGSITLAWKKVSENIPLKWEALVCDNKICYAVLEDSGTMNPVAPGDTGFLLLHITARVNYGTAVIRYAVWDLNNPVLIDTLTYILTVFNTGIDETGNGAAFKVFPNPVMDKINIISNLQTGFNYSIISINGMETLGGHSEANSISISTGDLSKGVYFLKISSGSTIYTQTIIK